MVLQINCQMMKKLGWKKNDYGVVKNFENKLEKLLHLEESNAPINWIKI